MLLRQVVAQGLVPVVELMLRCVACDDGAAGGASSFVNAVDVSGNTALHIASETGHRDIAEMLLKMPNVAVNVLKTASRGCLERSSRSRQVALTREKHRGERR